jgi:hypothetical protein
LKQILNKNQFFYYLELPEDERNVRYLSIIKGHFPLNFGRFEKMYQLFEIKYININNYFSRDVVASELILNVPERVDWKVCLRTIEEEKNMSADFRKEFKIFDPSAL